MAHRCSGRSQQLLRAELLRAPGTAVGHEAEEAGSETLCSHCPDYGQRCDELPFLDFVQEPRSVDVVSDQANQDHDDITKVSSTLQAAEVRDLLGACAAARDMPSPLWEGGLAAAVPTAAAALPPLPAAAAVESKKRVAAEPPPRRTKKVRIYLGLNGHFVEVSPTETVHTIVGEYAEDHWRRLREDLEWVVTDKATGEVVFADRIQRGAEDLISFELADLSPLGSNVPRNEVTKRREKKDKEKQKKKDEDEDKKKDGVACEFLAFEFFVIQDLGTANSSKSPGAVHGLDPRHLSLACALELQVIPKRNYLGACG
ncbi:hypothetical protein AK812_SmicGene35256 [Symbiodinium microadriaticum]|uniref:Uncharacterized protein n=1 Tax=Symbiodinium microadriaticum TaxID=2951 RepID=A0A1Q9CM10_SYMMI|nr:hypothetical protein AK812_SmicGene35256 [Symbiodinium microadriaticum]